MILERLGNGGVLSTDGVLSHGRRAPIFSARLGVLARLSAAPCTGFDGALSFRRRRNWTARRDPERCRGKSLTLLRIYMKSHDACEAVSMFKRELTLRSTRYPVAGSSAAFLWDGAWIE